MKTEGIAGLARSLLGSRGSLEGAGGGAPIEEAALAAEIEKRLAKGLGEGEDPVTSDEAAQIGQGIASGAMRAVERLRGGARPSTLSDLEISHLEAIVLLTGRPALRYTAGRLETPAALGENESWRTLVALARKEMERGAASVGLIASEPPGGPVEPVGTGWRLGANLIVTNRHVVQALAANPNAPPDTWTLRPGTTHSIDFAAVHETPGPQRFLLSRIAWSAEPEGPDIAVLELKLTTEAPPPPLTLDWDAGSLGDTIEENGDQVFRSRQIYVVGHPYRLDGSDAVSRVFGKADGRKRCSPGYVTRIRATGAIFDHDCSTLGGNSGSCVFSVDFHRVVGLHFSGVNTDDQGVGRSNVALSLALLSDSKAGKVLRGGR